MPRGSIKMTYYLCYGGPLMDRSLDRRVDTLRLEGQGRLEGFRMAFSAEGGRPNLEESAGSRTWGCLYLVEERMLPALDREEAGGERRQGFVSFEGAQEACVFYTYAPVAGARPDAAFVEALRSVYVQASLPQAQIDQALGLAVK
jgi:gamma-glutamylcyclotransferase (GGCT)/AIG2-like uncharacterized protein YtfP